MVIAPSAISPAGISNTPQLQQFLYGGSTNNDFAAKIALADQTLPAIASLKQPAKNKTFAVADLWTTISSMVPGYSQSPAVNYVGINNYSDDNKAPAITYHFAHTQSANSNNILTAEINKNADQSYTVSINNHDQANKPLRTFSVTADDVQYAQIKQLFDIATQTINLKNKLTEQNLEKALQSGIVLDSSLPVTDSVHHDSFITIATQQNNPALIKALLNANANINLDNGNFIPALSLAAQQGNLDMVQFLLDNGASPSVRTPFGNQPLHSAGTAAVIEALLKAGANIEAVTINDITPLHSAIIDSNLPAALALIENGAKIYSEYLGTAASRKNPNTSHSLSKALMDTGISTEAKNLALFEVENPQTAQLLLTNGADVNTRQQSNGATPLIIQAYNAKPEMVKFLLQNNAQINAQTSSQGSTALHAAIKGFLQNSVADSNRNVIQTIALLGQYGIDPTLKDIDGKTALDLAKSTQDGEIIQAVIILLN